MKNNKIVVGVCLGILVMVPAAQMRAMEYKAQAEGELSLFTQAHQDLLKNSLGPRLPELLAERKRDGEPVYLALIDWHRHASNGMARECEEGRLQEREQYGVTDSCEVLEQRLVASLLREVLEDKKVLRAQEQENMMGERSCWRCVRIAGPTYMFMLVSGLILWVNYTHHKK